jgi:hypothetical protein
LRDRVTRHRTVGVAVGVARAAIIDLAPVLPHQRRDTARAVAGDHLLQRGVDPRLVDRDEFGLRGLRGGGRGESGGRGREQRKGDQRSAHGPSPVGRVARLFGEESVAQCARQCGAALNSFAG